MRKLAVLFAVMMLTSIVRPQESIGLKTTLDRLLNETTRGRIIAGQHGVAQDKYDAEKIGYYIPEISFNTTLPSYRQSKEYGNYFGFTEPILFSRSAISSTGNLQLKQKIITGGDLTFQAAYDVRDDEYPTSILREVAVEGFPDSTTFIRDIGRATDRRRLGNFILQFSQPIFRSSESRSAYLTARDNLSKAEIQWRADQSDLKKEGINAYFDLITADIDRQISESQSQLAEFNAKWDSVKYADSVITEEAWIESKSTRLEKRLAMFDAEATLDEKKNDFNHLLDFPSGQEYDLEIPEPPQRPDEATAKALLANVDKSAETEMARINMAVAERSLGQSRSSMGLNGTLNASYSIGRGNVKQSQPSQEIDEQINTDDWRISVDFSYPIWDGGASAANIHSQELAYESARLEYLAAERSARNKMTILLKRIEINHSKLSLLDQELDLAEKKLQDAIERYAAGRISDATLLENRVYYFEAQKNRLATMKAYYLDLIELEKTNLP
jgi:outer membrane protein TolC